VSGGLRVLVCSASRHGATREIAAALAARLDAAAGLTAVHAAPEHRPDPAPYDAVVLGSAVYAGRWLEPAREWASAQAGALRRRPVWLFSSGPIGDPPFPPDEPHDVAPLTQLVAARGHAVFPGRLDKALLGFGERAVVTAMRAPLGDFRDWDAVAAWADAVAAVLLQDTAVPSGRG
jgi:menaquinone-dependent protoporphyrinogen oxidase